MNKQCEYIDNDGEQCITQSERLDKNGRSLCTEHYRYIRDGEKSKKVHKKRYTKKA